MRYFFVKLLLPEAAAYKSRKLASASWSPSCFSKVLGRWNLQSRKTSPLTTTPLTSSLAVGSTHSTLYTLHLTLSTQHFTLNTVHFTLDTRHSTLYALHSTHDTAHFIYTLHSTLYTLHFKLCSPHTHTLQLTLHTWHSTLYTSHSTIRTLHLTLYTLHFTLNTPNFTLDTLHSTFYTPHFTLHNLHFTLYTPHMTLRTTHDTAHSIYTLHSTLYTLHFPLHLTLQLTLHFTLYTPGSALYTSHCTRYTLHFTVHILHFTLYTSILHPLNFTLFTLNALWNFGLALFLCCARTPTSRPQLRLCTADAEGGPLNLPQSLVTMLAVLSFLIPFVQHDNPMFSSSSPPTYIPVTSPEYVGLDVHLITARPSFRLARPRWRKSCTAALCPLYFHAKLPAKLAFVPYPWASSTLCDLRIKLLCPCSSTNDRLETAKNSWWVNPGQ